MSSYCNLNCPMCTHSALNYDKQGFMEFEVWKKLIEDCAGRKRSRFLPFGLGESLLHPQAYEMLEYLFEKNKRRELFDVIILHTNALLMDRQISELFVKYQYQLGAVHFSLDAATQETYGKVRPGGELSLAIENIMYLLKRRTQVPPRMVFQFIVMKANHHEAQQFLKFWASKLEQRGLRYQVNYDWQPDMVLDTIFFKRETTWKPSDLGEAERLHKRVVESLGLIEPGMTGRILSSQEYIK